ncbi:MAG: transporter substrate-binding domain-containing protein [Desulfobacterales bacterium]|nr:transporter substrate-binding domain-containing protein [Desulfobacterales bacterium]MCP4159553.1 transporter substrate-binding domain-containing protein [Deltaproteobacteria bacterium]
MKLNLRVPIFFFLFLLSTDYSISQEYNLGVVHFPPFSVIDEDNNLAGLFKDMTKVLDHSGIKYKIDGYPLKRIYRGLKTGDINIFIGVKDKALDRFVLYSNIGLITIDLSVFTRGDVVMPQNYRDLKKKKFIVLRGYTYGGLINFLKNPANKITLEPTSNHGDALKMLKAKRADYIIDYKLPLSMSCKNIYPDCKGIYNRSLNKVKLYFLVSKRSKNAATLMKKIVNSFSILKKNGVINYESNI